MKRPAPIVNSTCVAFVGEPKTESSSNLPRQLTLTQSPTLAVSTDPPFAFAAFGEPTPPNSFHVETPSLEIFGIAMRSFLPQTWTGRLVDAVCVDRQGNTACQPTASTTSFALQTSGRLLVFDAARNVKAGEALCRSRDSILHRARETTSQEHTVLATVTGTAIGSQIQVDSIQDDKGT